MVVSSLLVADYLLTKKKDLTPMQVNKLIYISHGYTLAILDKGLIDDRIEAWKYGPVIPVVYYKFKQYGGKIIDRLGYCKTLISDTESLEERKKFFVDKINDSDRKIVDFVFYKYRNYRGTQLSVITHEKNTPWAECYNDNEMFTEIPNSVIKKHYKGLIND